MVRSAAAAFSASCSGRLAPTIAEAIFASRNTQASGNYASVQPACAAKGLSRSTAPRTPGFSHDWIDCPIDSLVAREAAGGLAQTLQWARK
jgi:hypothetical protein